MYTEVSFMAQSIVNFRLDENIKKALEKVCKDMGMSMSTAINIYLRQIARQKAIPFIISSAPVLSRDTLEAIDEGDRIAHDPNVPGYRDMESLRKALNS